MTRRSVWVVVVQEELNNGHVVGDVGQWAVLGMELENVFRGGRYFEGCRHYEGRVRGRERKMGRGGARRALYALITSGTAEYKVRFREKGSMAPYTAQNTAMIAFAEMSIRRRVATNGSSET